MKLLSPLLVVLAGWLPMAVQATPPAPKDLYLNDYAKVLTVEEQQPIRTIAQKLKADTDVELTVVIVERVSNYSETTRFETAVTEWFDSWGIGNAERNDGMLLFVALHDRAVRIELGAGYGRDHDVEMQGVVDRALLPAFRRGDYAGGIKNAVTSLDRFARDWQTEHHQSLSWWQRATRAIGSLFDSLWAKLCGLAAAGWTAWQLIRRWLRFRARNCERCGAGMVHLSEALDDRYLDAGQKLEERLQTVDYDVWRCTSCQHHLVVDFPAQFRRHRRCGKCHHLASEKVERRQLDDQVTTTYRCRHCQHTEYLYSQVGNDSSNHFGGGRSGGGGATGRW